MLEFMVTHLLKYDSEWKLSRIDRFVTSAAILVGTSPLDQFSTKGFASLPARLTACGALERDRGRGLELTDNAKYSSRFSSSSRGIVEWSN